jgi:uncharacterized protein DUF1259
MRSKALVVASAVVLLALTLTAQQKNGSSSDWKQVETALGRTGQMQPNDIIKFSMPRKDLKVTIAGTAVKPGLALGSWVAFEKSGNDAMAMGDLVLTEAEVQPVMKKLEEGGVQITALHNHLLGESPRVMYMHVTGHGDAVKIAQTLKDALALTKTPPATPAPAAGNEKLDIDTAQIDQILGHKGKDNGGIYQVSVPRAEKITDSGMDIPPSMGTATAINFQPTGGGKAAITGDFVLLGSEVNPVLTALREGGIEVTAVHSHMLTEEPRIFFMHYWANDDAVKLAKTLRAALDKTNSAK